MKVLRFCCAAIAMGCVASPATQAAPESLADRYAHMTVAPSPPGATAAAPSPAGSLAGYLALALKHDPSIRAAFERWRAATAAAARVGRYPEPTVSFGYFLRSVETRVGPQLARFGVHQSLPWPSRLSAATDAASAAAKAEELRFEAAALAVAQRLSDVYWRLWLVRRTRALRAQHLQVLQGLAEAALGRMSIGQATLAEAQRIALAQAKLQDTLAKLDDDEFALSEDLVSKLGLSHLASVPTSDEPPTPALPSASPDTLRAAVAAHPLIESFSLKTEESLARARSEQAAGYPSFGLGADWIVVGNSTMTPGSADSGKDAVMVAADLSLPLWRDSYEAGVASAEASARQATAEKQAAIQMANARLAEVLAALRTTRRRVNLYTEALIPQADATLSSLLGAFMSGQGTVADALLAQTDLLELRVEVAAARADHARRWAQLEELAGRPLSADLMEDRRPTEGTDSAGDQPAASGRPHGGRQDAAAFSGSLSPAGEDTSKASPLVETPKQADPPKGAHD